MLNLKPDEPVKGVIEIENLTFAYGKGPPALDDLSLTISEGETIALLRTTWCGEIDSR